MNKIVCDYCNEPAQIVEEPATALYCVECGNEHLLTVDPDRRVQVLFDYNDMDADGFVVKNLRREQ